MRALARYLYLDTGFPDRSRGRRSQLRIPPLAQRAAHGLLKYGKTYEDRGATCCEERHRTRVIRHLPRRAEALGFATGPLAKVVSRKSRLAEESQSS